MDPNFDKESFRLDPQAKSFQLTGFRWRDAPLLLGLLALSIAMLTGFNVAVAFGLSFLDREAVIFICGLGFGYLAGAWIGGRRTKAVMSPSRNSGQPVRSFSDAAPRNP